jgi:hypothetical protein
MYTWALRLLAPALGRGNLLGDNHVLVLRRYARHEAAVNLMSLFEGLKAMADGG